MTTNNISQRVAVLMGGYSAERAVSLAGGHAIVEALLAIEINAVAIDVDRNIAQTLATGNFTKAFVIMHGKGGEDGTIQGLLEWLQIPYTGSSILSSALAMDKVKTKQIWQALNITTPKYAILTLDTDFATVLADLGGKVVVKPVCEGSSIGITIATNVTTLEAAFKQANQLHNVIMAEQLITGDEYTVAIVDGQVLPIIKIETEFEFYDYQAKYQANTTKYLIPCGLDELAIARLQKLALNSYLAIGCSGWGRVDIMLDKDANPWVLEVNTTPGMTNKSLVPKAAQAVDISFNQLVQKILATARLTNITGIQND